MQIPFGWNPDRRLEHVLHRRPGNAGNELQSDLGRVVVPDLAVVRDEVLVGDPLTERGVGPLREIRRRFLRMRIDDVSIDTVEVVFSGQRRQIVLKRILHQPALEPDLVLPAALMDVVAESGHHQVQDVFVLAEEDVRSGGVEGKSLIDDRSAEAADAPALFEDFHVFVEVCRKCDSGDAAAQDADRQALSCAATASDCDAERNPCPICATTLVPSGSTV